MRARRSFVVLLIIVVVAVVVLAAVYWVQRQNGNSLLTSGITPAPSNAPATPPQPASAAPGTITIASFNVLHLGWNNNKDLDALARILARYDIIALEEVMKTTGSQDPLAALKDVIAKLGALTGAKWEYQATPQPLGRSSYKEYYAIIYRTDRVTYEGGAAALPDPADVFSREPFYATFKSGNFDFTLMAMHAEDPDDPLLDEELAALKDAFMAVQDESACENDVLIAGDFNKPADKAEWNNFKTVPTIENLIPASTKCSGSLRLDTF